MRKYAFLLVTLMVGSFWPIACGDSTAEVGSTQGGGANTGTAGSGADSGGSAGASAGGNGGSGAGTGGLPPPTELAPCDNHIFECGDLEDNDQDGLIDYQDPDCLGPCDNTEDSFYPNLPGATGQNCDLDCFWDNGQGHEEECYWDHHCDPYSDTSNTVISPQTMCAHDGAADPVGDNMYPPSPYNCDEMFNTQPQNCIDDCLPLAPNGCDCFGCCELDGQYVWVGSTDSGNTGTCDVTAIGEPDFTDRCHPCTPVPGCDNPCDICELCVGKTELPPECYPGEGGAGGGPPGEQCPPGVQACGLPNQPLCPAGHYCITGCCVPLPT